MEQKSAAGNKAEEQMKLIIAATWLEHPQQNDIDANYKAFIKLMHARKKIAIDIIETYDESLKQEKMKFLIEYNNRIKQVLGI